jgi:murein L,D-transpeptidase YafK
MKAAQLAALALSLLTGAAVAKVPQHLPPIDHIVVDKSDRTMTLFSGGQPVHVITAIQLGREPEGAKQFQGDGRTPEGSFTIDGENPDSAYHLSLHISYPDAQAVAFADAQGRNAGGQIFIHGQPNNWTKSRRVPGDWTDGCIALSDAEIEALWESVPEGATIEIVP